MAKNKKSLAGVPSYDKMMIPVLQALLDLGGSGTLGEINERVYEVMKLSESVLQIMHNSQRSQSEVDYRLAWSRTYLKKVGLIENSVRKVWTLADPNVKISQIKPNEIVKIVKEQIRNRLEDTARSSDLGEDYCDSQDTVYHGLTWQDQLIETLLTISPAGFEKLVQRLLRESGFVEVEVTGRSGDGGIDGKGIARMSGLLSFHVIFQCKRYKGSITPSQIRDFRGAMQGRADKGIFITTGSFTRDARKEATRDGAPPIDLIDGELLCEKLKEFSLGVSTKIVEEIEIDNLFFTKF